MSRNIKFYGGPKHGDGAVAGDSDRFEAVADRSRRADMWLRDLPLVVAPQYDVSTYYVKTFREQFSKTIVRDLRVAVLEGARLFPREQAELERDLHQEPWRVMRKVKILDDFDEWWRQAVLEATGWLVGKSGRIMRRGVR